MRYIYISYRLEDGFSVSERIYATFRERNKSTRVFTNAGRNLAMHQTARGRIEEIIANCDRVFLVIGPEFTGVDSDRRQRLFSSYDYVRMEILAATRQRVRIQPLLIKNATMPRSSTIPEDLHAIYWTQPIVLRPDNLEEDITKLLPVSFNPIDWLKRLIQIYFRG